MIEPVKWKKIIGLLDAEQVEKIHGASLNILSRTGVVMPLKEERYIFLEEKGARVDRKNHRVFFPETIIQNALKTAPAQYTLYARNREDNLPLDGEHGYLSLDGTGLEILDIDNNSIRPSTFKDLSDAVRVADFLPQISFLWPCVSARDKPARIQPLFELYAMLKNSGKHIQAMTVADALNAHGTVDICAAIAGGKAELKKFPIVSNFQCSISPLSYDENALEAALVFSGAGIPVGFVSMQIGSATAPATLAGSIAMGNAEILAGLTFQQLFFPGAPTFYGSYATMMELRTGDITAGGPDDFLLQAASAQMARFYKLPAGIGTFATGSKSLDWQAGMENAISGSVSLFCGADMICGAGLLNGATLFSYEQLLMDCEIYDVIRRVVEGVNVDEESLALEVIERVVNTEKHFMTDPHTIRHIREIWQPTVIDRSFDDTVAENSKTTVAAKANEKVQQILAKHEPIDLPAESAVLEIISDYEKRYSTNQRPGISIT
jgi:trimethylamine--corrinoid protein Co-methyltransferase